MRTPLKRAAQRILPPIVVDAFRAMRRSRRGAEGEDLEYLPGGWPEMPANTNGWDHESVAATHLRHWPAFVNLVNAPNVLVRTSGSDGLPAPDDYAVHNTQMVFAYVLALAAWQRERLSVLDWGCGLGQYAVLARGLMPDLKIDFHCRELPGLARAGRTVLPDATFHEEDEPALARPYDLVVASGSIQYVEDWRATLAKLATVTESYLYVTRMPIVERVPSFVVMQHPSRIGYVTEYPGWILNRRELTEAASEVGLRLLREFLIWERISVKGAPEQPDDRGFLFAAEPE